MFSTSLQALSNLKSIKVLANKVNQQVGGNSTASGRPPLPPQGPGYGVIPLAGSAVGNELSSPRMSDGYGGPSASRRSSRSSEDSNLMPMRSMPLPL